MAPASAASSSPRVACVPSILLESTASLCTKGRINTCGFGNRPPSPASLPIIRSASDNTRTSRGVHSSFGGNGAGTNAEYCPRPILLPGMFAWLPIVVFDRENSRCHYLHNSKQTRIVRKEGLREDGGRRTEDRTRMSEVSGPHVIRDPSAGRARLSQRAALSAPSAKIRTNFERPTLNVEL